MVRVANAAGITEDLAVYPLMHFVSGDQSGVWLPVVGGDKVNWRIWPVLVIVQHSVFHFYLSSVVSLLLNHFEFPHLHNIKLATLSLICRVPATPGRI